MGVTSALSLTRAQRAEAIARVLWITLALNWSTAFLKIIFGLLTHCTMIVADGVHSLSDGSSNVIGLIGIRMAQRPADPDHPYGWQKYETLTAVFISFFLFAAGLGILRQAISGLLHPRIPDLGAASFLIVGTTLGINLWVVWYERREGRRLKSGLLISDSWHTLTDVFLTLAVLAGLVGIQFHIPRVDAILSLVIAAVIFAAAFKILKQSSDILCDRAVVDPSTIENIVRNIPGISDCHRIRTRGPADDLSIDLYIRVEALMTVEKSHQLADQVENKLKERISGVRDVLVHVEPLKAS